MVEDDRSMVKGKLEENTQDYREISRNIDPKGVGRTNNQWENESFQVLK